MEQNYFVADRRFGSLISKNAHLEHLWSGGRWLEGPAYLAGAGVVVFSDIPNNRILRWSEDLNGSGSVTVFRQPSNNANGNTIDLEGRLVTCEHGSRRVTRTEHDGSVTVVADRFGEARLNSPNDVVVKRDGTIWFTDPDYGIISDYEGNRGESEIGACRLYRVTPTAKSPEGAAGEPGTAEVSGEASDRRAGSGDGSGASGGSVAADDRGSADSFDDIDVVDFDFVKPNGLAFSPDETVLYVSDTGHAPQERRGGSSNGPPHIRRFSVSGDDALSGGEVFAQLDNGASDGFRLDELGNVWTSAGDGVHCLDPEGRLLGKVLVPERVSNVCFGGPKRNRLYITATTSLYAVFLAVRGAR